MATTLTSTGVQFPDATVQTSAATGGRISVSDTAPTTPTQGDVWYDSGTAYRAYVWSTAAQAWVDIAPAGAVAVTNKVTVASTSPTSPTTGDIWYDSLTNLRGYIWSSIAGNWLDIAPSAASGIGIGQVWTNVTTSRVIGTTYTNSTGKPIMLSVTTLSTGSGAFSTQIWVNGVNIGNQVDYSANAGYQELSVIIIPPAATYKIVGTLNLQTWFELR